MLTPPSIAKAIIVHRLARKRAFEAGKRPATNASSARKDPWASDVIRFVSIRKAGSHGQAPRMPLEVAHVVTVMYFIAPVLYRLFFDPCDKILSSSPRSSRGG